MYRIWIIDDDRSIRWVLEKALSQENMAVTTFANANGILEKLHQVQPDVLITDIRMPGMDGLQLLKHIQHDFPALPVIVMTAHSDLDSAVSAYQGGAFEYLPKPFDIDTAITLTQRACELKRHHQTADEPEIVELKKLKLIGEAPAMQEVFRAIGRLSHSNITVLINGESGTGKELVAHALHQHSSRKQHPFIALNMAAIPHDLLESELFGHERGAFTGANTQRQGRFEQANQGTLFLDEIGDMPPELQTRLLRVLSDGEFYRVGGHMPIKVNVRIIAATHQNLEQRVQKGQFREDLYHRLNVIRIHIPALRERREDIPLLARLFLKNAAKSLEVEPKTLLKETEDYLSQLPWPGNVRQLENMCHWLMVMASGHQIHINDLPIELRQNNLVLTKQEATTAHSTHWESALQIWVTQQLAAGAEQLLVEVIPRVEKILIESALLKTQGHRQDAAKLLGWGRNTLTRKIKEYPINPGKS